ncbi:MAG: hypothetical protein ACI9XZ_000668 [Alphaproteobacteria bacterium]
MSPVWLYSGCSIPRQQPLVTRKSKKLKRRSQTSPTKTSKSEVKRELTMDGFLDRLMIAESGGKNQARNSLSTATGPFQFIKSTFMSVMQRHFPERVAKLSQTQILALRTDRSVARDAAKAYTRDNATYLTAAGHQPTFPHLRLAFLLGAGGAIRIMDAKPSTPLVSLLGRRVIRANPWMARHTAQSLIARSAREVSLHPTSLAGAKPFRDPVTGKLVMPGRRISSAPKIRVRCNLARPSCKRWLSLKRRSIAGKLARKAKKHVARTSKR